MERLIDYVQKLRDYPTHYPGVISVVPSDTHEGMYAVLDGHHRYAAMIMAGRSEALCLIVEEV